MNQGIRQGGLLSPILFSVFCGDALCQLNNSGLGCYLAGLMISAVMYADDILLITPSVEAIQKLICLCQSAFDDVLLHFNVTKCAACVLVHDISLHVFHLRPWMVPLFHGSLNLDILELF